MLLQAEEAKVQQPTFIPGSVLRVTFPGEEAMPAYQAINHALGGRDAGVRFTEMLPEVRRPHAENACAASFACILRRACSCCTRAALHLIAHCMQQWLQLRLTWTSTECSDSTYPSILH